ncbi:MAG: alkaline phosphatase family protein [Phormidium sp.]
MKKPVIAIGLDAAEPTLIEQWMAEGYLPNLSRLRDRGTYTRVQNFKYYKAETPWTSFTTGCSAHTTGYWSPLRLDVKNYDIDLVAAYDFKEYPPFYALGDDYRVAIFDMPQVALSENVNGIQILGWGGHSSQTPSHSLPANLFNEIVSKYGLHRGYKKDHAECLNLDELLELQKLLEEGIVQRTKISQDILAQENWDLFLTMFGETHAAGHFMWHLSQPEHPLYQAFASRCQGDPMREVFQAVDRAIGEIISKAPENANIVVFSAHGMKDNVMDLPSTLFLPELMYRYCFGKAALAEGKLGETLPPPITDAKQKYWLQDVWRLKEDSNLIRKFLRQNLPSRYVHWAEKLFASHDELDLENLYKLIEQNHPAFNQPATWYKSCWSKMKAFALASFSEGYVRINLQGRDPNGMVPPSEYENVCNEVTELLYNLKDGRTGQPMVMEVMRTRKSAAENDPKLPDADLVVIWQEDYATDVVDSPELGRIGPVPHHRTGSHRSTGFLFAQGSDIAPGTNLPEGHSLDLAPTILSLMGADIPKHFEGKSLIQKTALAGSVS